MEALSVILLPGALVAGVWAVVGASIAVVTFGLAVFKHLLGGKYSVAKRYFGLAVAALGCLAICALLLNTQPVEWPWAPWHIPIYLVIIGICSFSRRKAKHIAQEVVGAA